jgi:processive 1,2-diacylglycerol beta-glucosyltransferase
MSIGKKVLLLYITERSGHHSAALAIKKALESKDPRVKAICINAFKFAFPFADRIIHAIYLTVIKRVPKIWEKMYDNQKLVARSHGIKRWVHHCALKKVKRLIEDFKPDAIVCTQAFPCGIVADYKKCYASQVPLFAVLTDFLPHSFWIYDQIDNYIVHMQEAVDFLTHKGVPREKIETFGIPIDPKFSLIHDRAEIFSNYGLKQELPVIMIMGGSHGLGPIKDILYELDVADFELQIIVICGINRRLYEWVNRSNFKNRILSFKFTNDIDRLMSIVSLIVTKPGGITTAEALAKRLPMIILKPIPGQETRNTQLLIKNNVAFKVDSAAELLPVIRQILQSKYSGGSILSKPQSALDIAKSILAS